MNKHVVKVYLRAAMLRNRFGKVVSGWLYTPNKAELDVPGMDQEHKRPMLICDDERGVMVAALVVRHEGIDIRFPDGARLFCSFDALRKALI